MNNSLESDDLVPSNIIKFRLYETFNIRRVIYSLRKAAKMFKIPFDKTKQFCIESFSLYSGKLMNNKFRG